MPSSLVERTAEVLVAGKRLGLAPGPVEREHLLGMQALAQPGGAAGACRLPAGKLGMSPSRQVGLDSLLEGREPQLLEDARSRPARTAPGTRRALLHARGQAPPWLPRGMLGIPSGETCPPLGDQALEAVEVDAVDRELEQIARRARMEEALGERLAEL